MTFSPRTWVVGEVVSAAIMNQEIRDQFNTFFGAWTAYTPSWTTSGTAPVIGNGTLSGRYMKVGRTVICTINLVGGSSTTWGSGSFNLSLPVQAASAGQSLVGSAHWLGTARWVGQVVISPGASNVGAFFPISATNTRTDFATATLPETATASTQLRLTFIYEAAS